LDYFLTKNGRKDPYFQSFERIVNPVVAKTDMGKPLFKASDAEAPVKRASSKPDIELSKRIFLLLSIN